MKESERNSTQNELNISADDQPGEHTAELKREFVPPKLVKHGGLTELTGMPPKVFSP